MKIAILTTLNQWFVPYAKDLAARLAADIYFEHNTIYEKYDIVFMLSYHNIIPTSFLNNNRHNIVVHASELPKGKGWSPLFWQVLDGQNNIPFTMFEANSDLDSGDIYMVKHLRLTGLELHDEIRAKQAATTIEMCVEFVLHYDKYSKPKKQTGEGSIYARRSEKDSELNIDRTIRELFSLLRITSNSEYPAFFKMGDNKYVLTIKHVDQEEEQKK